MKELSATKIICTLGPKTSTKEAIKELIENGMSIARINMSHGSKEEYYNLFNIIKLIRKETKQYVAIAIDTKGPEFRIKIDSPLNVNTGDKIIISSQNDGFNENLPIIIVKSIKYSLIKNEEIIFIDDAKLQLKVINVSNNCILAECMNSFTINNNKRIAFNIESHDNEFLSQEDKEDIKYGIEQGADIILLSFVERRKHVKSVRELIKNESIQIVSKIESARGLVYLEEIIEESDGIMIARGDLATNVGISIMFSAQKEIIRICKKKPVIMATEMMLSMVNNCTPTRAEISDIGNSVFDGCSCLMLSSETAIGKHGAECVRLMKNICINCEEYKNSLESEEKNLINVTEIECKEISDARKYSIKKGVYPKICDFN